MSSVYVMTNSLFPGLCQIGSSPDVYGLLQSRTGASPGRYRIDWYRLVKDASVIAMTVKSILAKFEVPDSVGWYSCPADVAVEQFCRCMDQANVSSVLSSLLPEDKKHIRSVADLGDFCHTWRLQIGMSQQDLADHANVGLKFIVDLEGGESHLPMDLCICVAELLGIDLFAAKR